MPGEANGKGRSRRTRERPFGWVAYGLRPSAYWARSKSIALYARSFDSRWVESICRIVPDFERMTSEDVVAVSER